MPNQILDDIAREEIRAAMQGLKGKPARIEATRLAAQFGLSDVDTIYAMTRDVRPPRKRRSDTGKRKATLDDEPLKFAAELVADLNLNPALAIETARRNGFEIPVSDATFGRRLKESGLSRRQRRTRKELYVRFEAETPGEIFHYDDTGGKLRVYENLNSRKIIRVPETSVNENHPQLNSDLVQVWALGLVDDHSRRRFVRYVAANHLTSAHIAKFLLEGFREMGVPLMLYCDNAKPLRSKRMERAASLLDKAFEASGGFRKQHHAPLNSKASGKIEIAHKWTEECFRLFAVNGDEPTLEDLNAFAANMCERYNYRTHRDTGEAPMTRWQNTRSVVRVAPPATLDAAFLAQEFVATLRGDLTIKVQGQTLQLPREGKLKTWASLGQKVTVVLPHQQDWLVVIGQDGTEIVCDHVLHQPLAAGQFADIGLPDGEKLRRELKESRKQRLKKKKAEGARFAVPLVDGADAINKPLVFPKETVHITHEAIAEIPGATMLATASGARVLDYYDALDWLKDEGLIAEESSIGDTVRWLKTLFTTRQNLDEVELRSAWDARNDAGASETPKVSHLRLLKTA